MSATPESPTAHADAAWPIWPATTSTIAVTFVAGVGILIGHPVAILLTVAVPMLLLAGGWVRLLQLPSPRGTTAMLTAAAIILPIGGLLTRSVHISMLAAAVAFVLVMEFVHQLARQDRRPRLVESVSSAVFGIAVLTSGACFLTLDGPVGRASSLGVLVAVIASTVTDVLRNQTARGGRGWVSATTALVLGAAGGALTWYLGGPDVPRGLPLAAVAGAMAGLISYTLRLAFSGLPTVGGFRARWAAGAGALLVVGVVAYAQAWVILGSLEPLLTNG